MPRCTLCKVNFDSRKDLKSHVNEVHDGKKPFPCTECELTFWQKRNMEVHITAVHEGKKENICNVCGQTFARIEGRDKYFSYYFLMNYSRLLLKFSLQINFH